MNSNGFENELWNDPQTSQSHSSFGNFLAFRSMITPVVIQLVFWIGTVVLIIFGILVMNGAYRPSRDIVRSTGLKTVQVQAIAGFLIILIGPLVWRIWCEFVILFFRVNQTLTDIRNNLGQKG